MNHFYGYIRVSTARQGEGVSLQQQRSAIEQYAQRHSLEIAKWFEELETAAKSGRPVFSEMIKQLKRGSARGVIIHKIDRSARNLRDWADLGELIDRGIEVHFVNEALDLHSRGGRLSADIQAVVAADYIRNLREETKKGFYGRLQQGFFPMPAPLGYLNNGKGQAKTLDPSVAPMMRKAFELYATGGYTLRTLSEKLAELGLRRQGNRPIRLTTLSATLNNSFYYGLIRINKTGQTFTGNHRPLISRTLFDRVQLVLKGKLNTRTQRHEFVYRRRLTCRSCGHSLIGETHKGYVYYRCCIRRCPVTCVREEAVDEAVLEKLALLRFRPEERRYLKQALDDMKSTSESDRAELEQSLQLRLAQLDDRLARLTDAYIDRLIERELFEARKKTLLSERLDLNDQISKLKEDRGNFAAEIAQHLELADSAYLTYKIANPEEKRQLLDSLTSNRFVEGKSLKIVLALPFSEIAKWVEKQDGSPRRNTPRTKGELLKLLAAVIGYDRPKIEA